MYSNDGLRKEIKNVLAFILGIVLFFIVSFAWSHREDSCPNGTREIVNDDGSRVICLRTLQTSTQRHLGASTVEANNIDAGITVQSF